MNRIISHNAFGTRRVAWTFVDILLVLVAGLVASVLFAFVLGAVLRSLVPDPQAAIRSHLVIFSAVTGTGLYGILLLAVYLIIIRRRHLRWSALGFRAPPVLAVGLAPLVVFAQLTAAAMMNLLVMRLTGQFENPQIQAISGGQGFSWTNFLLMLLLAGVVAPIVEEVLFRGVLYGWLRARLPFFVAVLVSAALFAAAHVIPVLLPALLIVGIILALAYELSGSLWTSILLHALQNSLIVTLIFVALAFDLPLGR